MPGFLVGENPPLFHFLDLLSKRLEENLLVILESLELLNPCRLSLLIDVHDVELGDVLVQTRKQGANLNLACILLVKHLNKVARFSLLQTKYEFELPVFETSAGIGVEVIEEHLWLHPPVLMACLVDLGSNTLDHLHKSWVL